MNGIPEGYDFISEPGRQHREVTRKLHRLKRAMIEGPSLAGGSDDSIYRILTISQNKGTTCVFDWVKRLSITSEDYTGSSLAGLPLRDRGLLRRPEDRPDPGRRDASARTRQDHDRDSGL